jgi:hypothetical protein
MMWTLAVLGVAVVVALLRGGKLRNFTELQLRAWALLPAGFLLQVVAGYLPEDQAWSDEATFVLVLASYLLLLGVVWWNRNAAGMWLAGLGILMNFTVIATNGGMPVLPEAVILAGGDSGFVETAKHVMLDGSTRLAFLGDVIPLRFLGTVISLGDVFLAIGLGVFLEDQLLQPPTLFRHRIQGLPGSAAER